MALKVSLVGAALLSPELSFLPDPTVPCEWPVRQFDVAATRENALIGIAHVQCGNQMMYVPVVVYRAGRVMCAKDWQTGWRDPALVAADLTGDHEIAWMDAHCGEAAVIRNGLPRIA